MAQTSTTNGYTNGTNGGGAHIYAPDPNNAFSIKWDPKNLEIRTHSVEKTLEPLVMQVSFLDRLFVIET